MIQINRVFTFEIALQMMKLKAKLTYNVTNISGTQVQKKSIIK